MESPFGKRLFRQLLLFSLVPALLIAAFGYYLASERSVTSPGDHRVQLAAFAEYYNGFLYDRIDRSVRVYHADEVVIDGNLDFVFSVRDESPAEVRYVTDGLSPATFPSQEIAELAIDRQQGFLDWQGGYLQFRRVEFADGEILVGGLFHDESYGHLLELVQADLAGASLRRTLASNYLYFLATVFALIALATVGFAYYFAWRTSRSLASPLVELSLASQKIAGGDFDQQVRAGGVGEIAVLIDNFNQMAGQLKATTARLAQSERVAAWRNVARRFAHELKNPLQPIMVSLYRIESNLKQSGQYEQMIEPLRAASEEMKHLTELADRFSQLAKLPEPKIQPTNLTELLSSVASLYREQLADFDFQLQMVGEPVWADLDVTYFREALHNLILNAADASDRGERIVLRLASEAGGVAVQVQDFGCGMSSEVVSSARIPYFTTKDSGSGLGLAVAEKIVDELGGSLQIDSREGIGTTVTVNLLTSREQQ